MKPDPPIVLNGMARTFVRELLPALPSPFDQGTVGLSVNILGMLAQEVDRSAARLVEEDDAVAAILADARPHLPRQLLARVEEGLARPRHRDLHVSALQEDNNRFRALLVEVHAAVEISDTPGAAALNERIWAELEESTRRRHVRSRLA
ncbi:MAG: hypothetical protein U5Q44_09885 [Dehalococcoidia bacterium]|nr:hypothetical protein [Dehalococcoidia bacterium]